MDFYFGENKDESKVGFIDLGEDVLGLGALVTGITTGTKMCGARPLVEPRDEWEACVRREQQLYAEQMVSQTDIQKQMLADKKRAQKIILISVISGVSLALILITVYLVKRKKQN